MSEILLETLNQLDEWRHLPRYRLEPHVDVYFGMTLRTVLAKIYDVDKNDLYVIPEFPIRQGMLKGTKSNLYNNIDFCVLHKDSNQVFLVELKTDQDYIDRKQLCRMREVVEKCENCEGGFGAVVNDIVCYWKSKPRGKTRRGFTHLIWQLDQAGALCIPDSFKKTGNTEARMQMAMLG